MCKPLNVLMIEDSPDDAELVMLELTRGGFLPDFRRVETAQAMRDALASRQWDLILSDYCLPQFSAEAALETLLESGLDLPFIVLSGVIHEERAAELMRRGAHDFMEKSILARLVPAIEREIREVRERNQRREAERRLQALLTSTAPAEEILAALKSDIDALTLSNGTLEQTLRRRTHEVEAAALQIYNLNKRQEAAAGREARARHLLRQALTAVTEDFRGPLAVIDTAAQLLGIQIADQLPQADQRIKAIRGGVLRLVALTDSYLATEQLDTGDLLVRKRSVDLVRLIQLCVAHHGAAHPGHTIVVEATAPLTLWGDASLLAVVIDHLVTNAVKFSPAGGRVTIAAGLDREIIRISVSDQGIGVPAKEMEAIFHRLRRGSNVGDIPGSGLGLYLVRQIVEWHGGQVTVESLPGQGACFTVALHAEGR